ncbi:MAG TPA: ParB/RepB/Spo0J family partition protein [Gemmatimonadaceae bacterium]|nr:ParB/RepB/Spo0J family partition protein [Gemmatimonadaceae bacterium]
MSVDKPRRLGRGLEALIATVAPPAASAERPISQRLPIAQIRANPYQPRKEFRAEELAELRASLKANGLLQPIVVRPSATGGYELIAGERRLRAATELGWTDIPVIVRDIDDRTLLTLALVENLQRADLNAVEEAEGYQRLIDEFGLTQQQVADIIGKDRTTVANTLRVLQLPPTVRRMVEQGELSLGHARALLAFEDERAIGEVAREVVAKGLSVRDVEARARRARPEKRHPIVKTQNRSYSEIQRLEDQLRKHLQTDIAITVSRDYRGSIAISFYSADDLERLLDLLLGPARDTT